MTQKKIDFYAPEIGREEIAAAVRVLESGNLIGNGPVSREFQKRLREAFGAKMALYTTSATSAFQLGLIASRVGPGDEVILPSFSFVSIANAVVSVGAKPVFVDVEPETLNLDFDAVERAVTEKTRAVVPIHYAGVACDPERLLSLCESHGIALLEDAAQTIGASYKEKALGTWGRFGVISLHQTKNILTGEGGVFLTSDSELIERAEIVHEKGTNRNAFIRGEVDRYTWVDEGGSFIQSDLLAAVGMAQLEKLPGITARREEAARRMLAGLEPASDWIQLPKVPEGCKSNRHIFWIRTPEGKGEDLMDRLKEEGIPALSHYPPLHLSGFARRRWGTKEGQCPVAESLPSTLVRLPIHSKMSDSDADRVAEAVVRIVRKW